MYGRQIVVSLSRQLVEEYGPSFEEKNLRRVIQFPEVFPEEEIVVIADTTIELDTFYRLVAPEVTPATGTVNSRQVRRPLLQLAVLDNARIICVYFSSAGAQ